MTGEHFREFLYTIMLSTRSDKWDICRHLNVSKVTLNKWLRYRLPVTHKFLILDRLEEYLFANFGRLASKVKKNKSVWSEWKETCQTNEISNPLFNLRLKKGMTPKEAATTPNRWKKVGGLENVSNG